jgi:hypothetical protein
VAAPPFERTQQTKSLGGQGGAAVNMAVGAVEPRSSTVTVMRSVEPAADEFSDEDALQPTTVSQTAISNKPVLNEVSSTKTPQGDILPSREAALGSASPTGVRSESSLSKGAPLLLNPEDDPGDLFEPAAGMPAAAPPETAIETATPPPAPESGLASIPKHEDDGATSIVQSEDNVLAPLAVAEAGSLGADISVESSNPPRPLRLTAAAVPPSVPRPEPTDPLALIRALSEEEMIALFS